jgi:hypothetical protein
MWCKGSGYRVKPLLYFHQGVSCGDTTGHTVFGGLAGLLKACQRGCLQAIPAALLLINISSKA